MFEDRRPILDSIYYWLIAGFTNLEGKWLRHSTDININKIYAQCTNI